jgi:hypothetical protein
MENMRVIWWVGMHLEHNTGTSQLSVLYIYIYMYVYVYVY